MKTTDFQLVFNFEQMCTVTIFGEHGRTGLYFKSGRLLDHLRLKPTVTYAITELVVL